MKFWKKYDIFSFSQFRFLENHSTILAISYLREYFIKGLDNKLIACSTFVDLAKAFYTVNHNKLQDKLEQNDVRGTARNLIKSHLHKTKKSITLSTY